MRLGTPLGDGLREDFSTAFSVGFSRGLLLPFPRSLTGLLLGLLLLLFWFLLGIGLLLLCSNRKRQRLSGTTNQNTKMQKQSWIKIHRAREINLDFTESAKSARWSALLALVAFPLPTCSSFFRKESGSSLRKLFSVGLESAAFPTGTVVESFPPSVPRKE